MNGKCIPRRCIVNIKRARLRISPFRDLLSEWGIRVGVETLADAGSSIAGRLLTPLVQRANGQYVSTELSGVGITSQIDVTFFPDATAVGATLPAEDIPPHTRFVPLALTTQASWLETDVDNPRPDPIELVLKRNRIKYWMGVGAQPSDTVKRLIRHHDKVMPTEPAVEPEEEAPAPVEAVAEAETSAAEGPKPVAPGQPVEPSSGEEPDEMDIDFDEALMNTR